MAPNPEVKQKEGQSQESVPSLATSSSKNASGKRKYNDRLITKIHNKYYDLTDFKHPGGPLALGCIDNRDGTELFESHHLFTKKNTLAILSSYEMKPAPIDTIPSSNVYDWELTKSSPFTKELQEGARQILGQDIKISWGRIFESVVLFAIAYTQIKAYIDGHYYALLTFPVTFWIWSVNIYHDASHFAYSKNWKINKFGMDIGFMFSTPYAWMHQHVIGHHSFPNIYGKDPDLYHAPKYIRHSSDIRLKKPHLY